MSVLDFPWNPSRRELKQFAVLWFPAACAVAGFLVYLRLGSLLGATCCWGAGAAVGLIGGFRPHAVRPIYLGVMFAAYPIGWTISHALLALIYYGMFTPLGLLMRLLGRDPLHRAFDREAASYWTPRPPTKAPKSYFRQF